MYVMILFAEKTVLLNISPYGNASAPPALTLIELVRILY